MIIYNSPMDYPESEMFDEEEYQTQVDEQESAEIEKAEYLRDIAQYD